MEIKIETYVGSITVPLVDILKAAGEYIDKLVTSNTMTLNWRINIQGESPRSTEANYEKEKARWEMNGSQTEGRPQRGIG